MNSMAAICASFIAALIVLAVWSSVSEESLEVCRKLLFIFPNSLDHNF